MNLRDVERRVQRQRQRRHSTARARLLAGGALVAVAGLLVAIILTTTGGGKSSNSKQTAKQTPATTKPASSKPGTAAIPILTYHVINSAPAGSGASPDLYVPGSEFSAQMQALKSAGWTAVTLDQVEQYWTKGTALPTGKPIVVTFDGGYASQFVNALPVLKGLGWKGVINLPSNGRSPADGGLTDDQTRGLVAAGWELDAAGNDSPDLTGLSTTEIVSEVKAERQDLQARFKAPVNWYSYASGAYNAVVTASLSEAGFVGATTTSSGWANPKENRFRLPRIAVAGGTSSTALISKISDAQAAPPPPDVSAGV